MPETQTLPLAGGRSTGFVQWGDPGGQPVIHLHGTPGSRLERYVDEAVTASLGIRFITLDRPGYGAAEPVPGWTLLDCASVVAGLADHLGLDRFKLHAMSGGAPYALATAWALGDRVAAAAIVAGLGPLDRPGALDGMSEENVAEYAIARAEPERLGRFLSRRRTAPAMPEAELATLSRIPGLLDMLIENHGEMTRQGQAGTVSDHLAVVAPWGFRLQDVAVPLHLWHGDRDTLVPIHHAEHVAATVPRAVLHRRRGEGHFDMFARQRDVLGLLADQPWAGRGPDGRSPR
ncbi:alpha/beta hydrolase [Arenibaculum sp.]|uniref:alpha/beta fold hydrolase n=1 Tax=Arenibaculum sp. TaxID=2865862 RepID=UPI002E164F31|nr:alpha/beta hydrolase [Arenibaculum sp.]